MRKVLKFFLVAASSILGLIAVFFLLVLITAWI